MSSMWPSNAEIEALDRPSLAEASVQLADARHAGPEPVVIDLPDLDVSIEEDPDTHALSLLIHDESGNGAELVTGLAHWHADAISGLEKLAERAGQLAALLKIRGGSRAPLPTAASGEAARSAPSVNLGQPHRSAAGPSGS